MTGGEPNFIDDDVVRLVAFRNFLMQIAPRHNGVLDARRDKGKTGDMPDK